MPAPMIVPIKEIRSVIPAPRRNIGQFSEMILTIQSKLIFLPLYIHHKTDCKLTAGSMRFLLCCWLVLDGFIHDSGTLFF
ncbi:Uncharacterised protein [Mycobacteroides abscessus subsp. abscessus]|nr:Uncharacterised protein [Mycobacteroides abscessus subsp. abscessus]